jgi:SAM-dependent methyltransferase
MAETITAPFKDHFSIGSSSYAAFRPRYPQALVEALAAAAPGRRLALDGACGTGQLTVPLADRFEVVVGCDASVAQIAAAEAHPRVRYLVAPAEALPAEAASVDLITVAQAAHWLDLDRFYAEVQRVARPGGVVALITYGIITLEGPAGMVVDHFYRDVIGSYWPPERAHVETGYRDLPFPFAAVDLPEQAMVAAWDRDALVGYVRTWSAVTRAKAALGTDPAIALEQALAAVWPERSEPRRVTWPLSVRAGRVGLDG